MGHLQSFSKLKNPKNIFFRGGIVRTRARAIFFPHLLKLRSGNALLANFFFASFPVWDLCWSWDRGENIFFFLRRRESIHFEISIYHRPVTTKRTREAAIKYFFRKVREIIVRAREPKILQITPKFEEDFLLPSCLLRPWPRRAMWSLYFSCTLHFYIAAFGKCL